MKLARWIPIIALLLIAVWLRTWQLDRVPPGPHFDAVINAQIVEEFIWPAWPAPLRPPATSGAIPWLTIQHNPQGPDLQEHAWLYQTSLALSMRWLGTNLVGLRFPDLAWGTLGLAASCALVRRVWGRQAALITLALQAVSFWSIFMGRAGLRAGTIVPLLALAGCAFWDAWMQTGDGLAPRLRKLAVAGALLGLAMYGYLSARPMVLALLAFAVCAAWARRVRPQRAVGGTALFLGITALVVAPLAIYQATHPEDNLRVNMLSQPLNDLLAGRVGTVIQTGLATLGMFAWKGDPQWQYNAAGRPVFDPLGALVFIVGLTAVIIRWRRPGNWLALVWLAVSLVPGVLSLPAPHMTRTVAAQPIAFGLAAWGALCILGAVRRARPGLVRPAYAALAAWWVGFAVWNYSGYLTWARNDEVRFYHQGAITEAARYLDRSAGSAAGLPVAACSVFLNEYEDFFRSPRQTLHFVLQRQDIDIRWFDCRDSLVIPAGGQARILFPGLVPYTSTMDSALTPWMQGARAAHDDGLPDGTLYTLDATAWLDAEVVSVTSSSTATWASQAWISPTAPGPALPVDFGHIFDFLGYRVDKARRQAGKEMRVLTYWRVRAQPPLFLTGFMHLLSDPQHVIAQHDRQAILYDTLRPGDIFVQLYSVTIPEGTPPGEYRLSTGWYQGRAQERLAVYEGETARGDRVILQSVTVRK